MTTAQTLPPAVLLALASGRKEIARNALVKVVKEDPFNTFGWLCLATTLPREQAIQALRKALLLEPDNLVALRNLARLRENPHPGFTLELSDVWMLEEAGDEEASALFGNEQPTFNLRSPEIEAKFGEETATMPVAFMGMSAFSNRAGGSNSISALLAALDNMEEVRPAHPPVEKTVTLEKPKLQPLRKPLEKPIPLENQATRPVSNHLATEKPALKLVNRPITVEKPEIRSSANLAEKPVAVVKPEPRPGIKPVEKPAALEKPALKPVERPAAVEKPQIKSVEKPTVAEKTESRPVEKPVEKPVVIKKSEIKPARKIVEEAIGADAEKEVINPLKLTGPVERAIETPARTDGSLLPFKAPKVPSLLAEKASPALEKELPSGEKAQPAISSRVLEFTRHRPRKQTSSARSRTAARATNAKPDNKKEIPTRSNTPGTKPSLPVSYNRSAEVELQDSIPSGFRPWAYIDYGTVKPELKYKPRMPRLHNGPRPVLGTAQQPRFGFTAFGLFFICLLVVLAVLLVVFCIAQPV